ncbi:MAG: hypothetical protein H8E21_03095 [Gammaproteobacteria bacterium]|nr:hypothetical protein [Gammaproteobacteria bacterium]MBL7000426.1 hypothetical protein [Gammaproteobacteria bacterium]
MEDLVRRVSQGSSVSLISGVRGVGKSRFLEQFYATYHDRFELVLVRFEAENSIVFSGSETTYTEQSFLKEILRSLKPQSGLIIDQFDFASSQTQREIFSFYSLHAMDKGLSLIFSAQTDSLQPFIALSESSHLTIGSAELCALDYPEQLEYIRATCCKNPGHSALLSGEMKKQLALTGGVYSNLRLFIQHHRGEISCTEPVLQGSFTPAWAIATSVLALIVMLTGGYWFTHSMIRSGQSLSENLDNQPVTESPLQNNSATVPSPPRPVPLQSVVATDVEPIVDNFDSPSSKLPEPNAPAVEQSVGLTEKASATEKVQPAQSNLQQRIQATLRWLASSNDHASSIQIMSLDVNKNPEQSLNRYLQELESENIDLDEIKIYRFTKKGRALYGVLYGSYANTVKATESIENLPAALKANSPIIRTIKGINDEINLH